MNVVHFLQVCAHQLVGSSAEATVMGNPLVAMMIVQIFRTLWLFWFLDCRFSDTMSSPGSFELILPRQRRSVKSQITPTLRGFPSWTSDRRGNTFVSFTLYFAYCSSDIYIYIYMHLYKHTCSYWKRRLLNTNRSGFRCCWHSESTYGTAETTPLRTE